MDFRFLGARKYILDCRVEASVRAANFINHLNVRLTAHKMLMQIFIGVLVALLAFGLFVLFFVFVLKSDNFESMLSFFCFWYFSV